MRGNLECLRYLHENGCPWTASAYLAAAEGGHLDCVRYIVENGGPTHDLSHRTIPGTVVPYLYHRGLRVPETHVRSHIRRHVRSAWTLVRCAVVLLRMYSEACERVYSPDGVGYREAELSFRETVVRNETLDDLEA